MDTTPAAFDDGAAAKLAASPLMSDVLLVEDETMISFLVEDMLTELGARMVRIVHSLEGGLAALAARAPSLAVLDINLGGKTAFPLAEALSARGIPFIFTTGYGRCGLGERWSAYHVLQKPMTADQLAYVLRRVVRGDLPPPDDGV